jgi:hypothetical protein
VPLVGGAIIALEENAARVVLTHFHLVAHHRHLGVEIFARDEAVHHPRRPANPGTTQVVFAGGEAGKVVGAVQPGGAIGTQAALGELRPHRAVAGRALEQQVLQQVRHAGFAVVLVLAANPIGDVDRGGRLAVILDQQHLQAVGQPVLVDAFDAGLRLTRLGRHRRRNTALTRMRGRAAQPGHNQPDEPDPQPHAPR